MVSAGAAVATTAGATVTTRSAAAVPGEATARRAAWSWLLVAAGCAAMRPAL